MQIFGVYGDGLALLPASGGFRWPDFKLFPSNSEQRLGFSCGFSKNCQSGYAAKLGIRPGKCRSRTVTVRASGSTDEDSTPIAPLQFESPTGQFLSQILNTHPHLIPAAIDQQLESLQTDRDEQNKEIVFPAQSLLYRRISEVKNKERKKAVEEIIYCLIVHKFVDKDISMIPKISHSLDPAVPVDSWPNQEQKLESVHSPEAFEMIESHLSLVLGERLVGPLSTVVQISKLRLGKLYAASIMYGYFLRRVDQRFQLERSMKTLSTATDDESGVVLDGSAPGNQLWDVDSLIKISIDDSGGGDDADASRVASSDGRSYKLRSYVMYLDAETLQRYATIRSKEAISLIEKQTQALFGRPDIRIAEDGSLNTSNDEVIGITFAGLTMLVLEAVAFGTFLWDAEDYVESRYHFIES